MNHLILKDLELFGFHGVYDEEKSLGQKFLIDMDISIDLSHAGESDNLNETINYGKLCQELQEIFTKNKYKLLEKATTVLCDYILMNYTEVTDVEITLKKPWAPIHLPIKYPAVKIKKGWHKAYIAIGSNLGDKLENIKQAMDMIEAKDHTCITKKSTLIETEPVGYQDQDTFINGVFMIKTLLTPIKLINWLLSIEKELKRERIIKWGPRTIDLDIIYYDNIISCNEAIVLPHPRMHERDFVLRPLNEIAPYEIHPILQKRTFQILNDLNKGNGI